MKIFLDTADINDIKELVPTGLINGVTTNPSLILQSDRPFKTVIREICEIVPGPVSAEVTSSGYENMLAEGRELAKIAANVVVKLPLTMDGLKVCRQLAMSNISTNVTLCFSATQALLAAKAGATYVSPFIGRIDDVSVDGLGLIFDIVTIFNQYPSLSTEILAASIRHPLHVVEAAKMGVSAATLPPKIFKQLYEHPLTKSGLAQFDADWGRVIAAQNA
ncbi:MAG: fructose-6-phosphate aldolase [Alphaproteobacteria bacterium]|nr:fructose-6-phosphate aldolase [Alphaproteobacteria bacterium]OJV46640.1 MAG: fructose-6-phosphate aldolase [Alphaproteobacteria bacterium 43-37]